MGDPDLTHTILRQMREGARQMQEDLLATEARLNARFDTVDRRFDAVDARFESMEDRLEGLEHHATVTNSKLDAIHGRLESAEVVRDEAWAQVAASASFTNRFERRHASELAELRSRVERLEAKDRG